MPFQRPTLPEIIQRTFSDLTSRLQLKGALLRRSVVGVLARVLAGASHLLHGHLDYLAKQINPGTADGVWLALWANVWGVARREAEFSVGTINFVGTIEGATIPAGSNVKRSDGIEFATQADATIAGGVASADVRAVDAGAAGNTDAGVTLTLVFPIAGVNSSATVDADGLTNGSDVELDESLRARLLLRIQKPPQGGDADDYVQWALDVPGVTRAWCYPLHLGPGTVGVTFMRDDDTPSPIPSTDEVAAVQSYIDGVRPVTAQVTVFAPVPDTLNFQISITPSTDAVKAAITAELDDFMRREAEPGGTLFLSRINEAISTASGEVDHTLIAPAANVVSATGHIPQRGTITWA